MLCISVLKWKWKELKKREVREFSYTLCPSQAQLPPLSNSPHQSRIFVTVDEPTLKCYNQPKSIVYIRVHTWCTSIGLDKCIMIWVHHYNVIEYFHCPKTPLCSTYLSISPPLVLYFMFIFTFHKTFKYFRAWGFPGGSVVKNPPTKAGDTGMILEWGRSLEEEMATHSSILAWEIPWTEEPGGLQSVGSQKLR